MPALDQFAHERGLEYRLIGPLDGPFPILRWGDDRRLDGYARGRLTDEHDGTLAGLVCVSRNQDGWPEERPFVVVLCELRESAAALPILECRSHEAEASGCPDPLMPGMQAVRLESEFFDTRFTLLSGPGTDLNVVYQLFAPKFLDWYAYEAPYGLSMALLGGSLCVYAPAELERPGRIDSIWDAAARIAVEVSREGAS
jgi:hypothetical protein